MCYRLQFAPAAHWNDRIAVSCLHVIADAIGVIAFVGNACSSGERPNRKASCFRHSATVSSIQASISPLPPKWPRGRQIISFWRSSLGSPLIASIETLRQSRRAQAPNVKTVAPRLEQKDIHLMADNAHAGSGFIRTAQGAVASSTQLSEPVLAIDSESQIEVAAFMPDLNPGAAERPEAGNLFP